MNRNPNVVVPFNEIIDRVFRSKTTGYYREPKPQQLEQQEYYDLKQAHALIELGYNMAREHAERLQLASLDRDISEMKNVVQASEDRIARMIENALTEMRDRDNQRHQEMSEIRSNLDHMRDKIDQAVQIAHEEKKWVIGTTVTIAITTVLAIAGMFATILLAK